MTRGGYIPARASIAQLVEHLICNQGVGGSSPSGGTMARRETTQFQMVAPSQAWVTAPGALLAMERRMAGVAEQRITLPNDTSFQGENFLFLVARQSGAGRSARYGLEGMFTRDDVDTYPFANLSDGEMMGAQDSLGTYNWTMKDVGGGIVCVVGVRTIRYPARLLPQGASAMDVMLRNCVRGSRELALAPFGADRLGQAAGAAGYSTAASPRMLSPLAAPLNDMAAQP
jgi:hypothetical protein